MASAKNLFFIYLFSYFRFLRIAKNKGAQDEKHLEHLY
ncbi:hypothetical protein CUZ93_0078 [Enterococcus xinjiangensis]|nr:hypothetical protein [Enterococcus lactis]MBL4999651.1 hypothetical protein [Enterococcus lactis]MBL5010251.1 hypothetical protein [Enterococcus lactis]MBL5015940.1 hypothetical protein [Enterococcus lactis]